MKTVLLIDDDEEMRRSFGSVLRRNGYHVIEADSGVTGLKMARKHLPDLILSDIHMPGGDGSTLLREIRADPELKSKQIVLMTGKPELVSPRRGMEEGADDFLIKPVEMEALLKCMAARFERASISWRVEDQTLNQLRSSVPAHLPHEFFTPMAGIIGLVEILRSSLKMAPADMSDIYNDLYQSALRLNRTLRNYLLVLEDAPAPKSSPRNPLTPKQVEESIHAGVKEALRLNDREADITTSVSPCQLAVEAGDLSRVVEELVDNACKFSRHGTSIEINLTSQGWLTVRDFGRGFTPEQISRIGFFKQFDRNRYEQQGLGLGLVLVRKIADEYQGNFSIQSEEGKGAEVKIEFPLFPLPDAEI